MDAQLKEKWVKALRSGEYQQARNELERDGGYCCLGVLCKVVEIDIANTAFAYNRLARITGDYHKLVTLNDDKGLSFPEIADYIEANL